MEVPDFYTLKKLDGVNFSFILTIYRVNVDV